MLVLTVPERESYDEKTNRFVTFEETTIKLEHSLLSLSKWEEKWHKPYLGRAGVKTEHTDEEVLDYMRCMCMTRNLPEGFFETIDKASMQKIIDYIQDPHTATTFSERQDQQNPARRQTVTAEVIYYWMLKAEIPFECEKWNLSRLLTLIRVCEVMDSKHMPKNKGKKPSKASAAAARREMNMMRRQQLNTTG